MNEITFQNKREDRDAYYDYFLATKKGQRIGRQVFVARTLYYCFVIALIFTLVWGALGYFDVSMRWSILIALACSSPFVLGMIIGLAIMRFKPSHFLGKQVLKQAEKELTELDFHIFQLPRTIRIEEEWLEVSNSEAFHKWRWGIVDSVVITSDFIYLAIGDCCTFYLPKRDFLSAEDFLSFGKKLTEMVTRNKNQPLSSKSVVQR